MDWHRRTMSRLECDLSAYRGVVERVTGESTWTARVESRTQTYTSVFEYMTMHEAQQWVERKIEVLLDQRSRTSDVRER